MFFRSKVRVIKLLIIKFTAALCVPNKLPKLMTALINLTVPIA